MPLDFIPTFLQQLGSQM